MLKPELFGKILESAPDAIVVVDSEGRIEFASHRIIALLGYTPEELLGQGIELLLPKRFRDTHHLHRHHYERAAQPRPMGIDLELYALHKDGSELPVEISLSPIHDGERLLVAAAIRDVTERKRVLSELTIARESADRANQTKSRFLATASHDLRQPLQTLALLNGTLRRVVTDSTATEAIAQEGQAIEAMSKLLNALLDISKLESGAIRPDPTDFKVANLFEELRTEFATLAASKGLELRIHAAAQRVHSDPALVGQILRNLVSNAIKYTRAGWVELRADARSPDVCVEVVDTGIGIPAEQLPYIYDEFYQIGVSSNSTREGYGLGLSIVQRLVRLLGLRLEVRSEVGCGSTFALQLPPANGILATPRLSANAQAQVSRGAASQCVLLVDDDPGVRNATRLLLKVEGFRVLPAGSFDEAMQQIRDYSEHSPIDLLITDYHLTNGKTGLDVIAAVREVAGDQLAAILITGDTSAMIRDLKPDPRIRLASKPVKAEELLASIKALLSGLKGPAENP